MEKIINTTYLTKYRHRKTGVTVTYFKRGEVLFKHRFLSGKFSLVDIVKSVPSRLKGFEEVSLNAK